MASGWWKSTHANLAEGSPVDFEVTTALEAPRGFPKLASIATGAGLFLGGVPYAVVDDVIYYAGDDYVQDTDKPTLNRFDGRIHTSILELPFITGTTPSKAILSITADDNGRFFISTWDSGTGSSDFAGRIYVYADNNLTRVDGGLFTSGKLPYALVWFNDALYVGVTKQNPTSTTEVIKLTVDGALPGGPGSLSATLTGTTYTYQIGCENGVGLGIGQSAEISVLNNSSLNATYYNALSWSTTGLGTDATYDVERVAPATGNIVNNQSASDRTYDDMGAGAAGGAPPGGGTPQNITLTVTANPAQSTTTTYRVGALINGFEFMSDAFSVSAPAELQTGLYVALSWGAVTGATSYRVYRTAGHTSTGLIATTASTTLSDTGLAGTGSLPELYSTTALTSGAVACMVVYGSDLYIGSYQPASTFGKVFKLTTGGVLTTSQTAAPGGSAAAYNGYTAGIVFESNLYMGYWNDDATDVCLIEKFNGSSWSTVSTVSGAGARPWVTFAEADGMCYAYGGGDAKTGILYESADGSSWTNISSLLPSSLEAIPFIGSVNVIGGF